MIVNKPEIIKLLNLHKSGNRGWMLGDCVFCNKKEHLGVIFEQYISSFRCFKCGKTGSIDILLSHIKRLDLLDYNKQINIFNSLEHKDLRDKGFVVEKESVLKEKSPPLGFRRQYYDEYLVRRGFCKENFLQNEIGLTQYHPILKNNYIIFLIKEQNLCVGYLGRKRLDKYSIPKGQLRWYNSPDTDFEELLFGIDEVIKGKTREVILVEGVTSKINVDNELHLYDSDGVKCCCTFGKKISIYQIKKLLEKGVEKVYLLYDPDAINQSKDYGELISKFLDTKIGHLEDKDPGELDCKELERILVNSYSSVEFNLNVIQNNVLT